MRRARSHGVEWWTFGDEALGLEFTSIPRVLHSGYKRVVGVQVAFGVEGTAGCCGRWRGMQLGLRSGSFPLGVCWFFGFGLVPIFFQSSSLRQLSYGTGRSDDKFGKSRNFYQAELMYEPQHPSHCDRHHCCVSATPSMRASTLGHLGQCNHWHLDASKTFVSFLVVPGGIRSE